MHFRLEGYSKGKIAYQRIFVGEEDEAVTLAKSLTLPQIDFIRVVIDLNPAGGVEIWSERRDPGSQ